MAKNGILFTKNMVYIRDPGFILMNTIDYILKVGQKWIFSNIPT